MKLGIDPGHGGARDRGAQCGGVSEKDLNWAFCSELLHSLPWQLVEPRLLRVDDEYIPHTDRAVRAADCDLIVSVHHNASKRKAQAGAEIYLMPGYSDLEHAIATTILESMPRELQTRRIFSAYDDPRRDDDDWLQRPYNVLRHHVCRRLLVEVGYMTNQSDMAFMMSDGGRTMAVSAVRAGIGRALAG